jgi:hypothetical protein
LLCIFSGTKYTVEGEKDVGKEVLKVKRGVVILGKITSYSVSQKHKVLPLTSHVDNSKSSSVTTSVPPLIPYPAAPSSSPSSSSERPINVPKNLLTDENLGSSSAFGDPFYLHPTPPSPAAVTSILPRDSPSLPLPSPSRKQFHQDICKNEHEDRLSLISNALFDGKDEINRGAINGDNEFVCNVSLGIDGEDVKMKNNNDHVQTNNISTVNSDITRENLNIDIGVNHRHTDIGRVNPHTSIGNDNLNTVLGGNPYTDNPDTNMQKDSLVTGVEKVVSWSIDYDDGSKAVLNYEELRKAFKEVEEYMVVKEKLEGRVLGKLVFIHMCADIYRYLYTYLFQWL